MPNPDAIPTHLTTVARTEDLGPWYRRITFAGGDLARYRPIAPDEFVYLLLPPPGRTELTIDGGFTWTACRAMPDDERPVGAYYTVRAFRPDAGELDVDVFLHEVPGPASAWARAAKAGDPAALWGPRTTFEPPVPPAAVDWWLLVADESGLPALAAILDWLPADAEVRAIVEVPAVAAVPTLPSHPALTVLERGSAEAGTTTQLADAVRALARPEGRPYVWGGGESRAMAAIRRHLRQELGHERAWVSLTAYWRHAAHAAHADDDTGDGTDDSAG